MFKETGEVSFDTDGFAVHKRCGERLFEEWNITRFEDYHLKRDGETVLAGEGGNNRECDGVWCADCDVAVTMVRE